jgi:predicted AAA+ superfamily ATPase
MAFVTGPRQVGKTTVCRDLGSERWYLNWDDQDDREVILAGPGAVADRLGLSRLQKDPPVVVFDELHKYRRWRTFLKGFYDRHQERVRIVVTGSARFDVFRQGGDSLMGRYLRYRLHPLSVGELVHPGERDIEILPPRQPADADWEALLMHGGFPEPFVHADGRFSRRWQGLRSELLIRQDVRDLTRIQELDQLEMLVRLLAGRSGAQVNYTALSNQVRTSVDTMRRWIGSLCQLHHGFLIRPWFRNVARSLRKEPKWYLRDWSMIEDPGSRAETMIACHLKKAVESWEDAGFGSYALHYLRDKEKREVDFLVVRNSEPWFLVEVKRKQGELHPALTYFRGVLGAPHTFQVVLDLPYMDADCFQQGEPTLVPAATFLSQLP